MVDAIKAKLGDGKSRAQLAELMGMTVHAIDLEVIDNPNFRLIWPCNGADYKILPVLRRMKPRKLTKGNTK